MNCYSLNIRCRFDDEEWLLFIFKTLANNSILLRCFESLLVELFAFFLLDPLLTLLFPGFCIFFFDAFGPGKAELITFTVTTGVFVSEANLRPAFLSRFRFFCWTNFNEVKSMMFCVIWEFFDSSDTIWIFFCIESAWSFDEFVFVRMGMFLFVAHTAQVISYKKKWIITVSSKRANQNHNILTAIGFTDFLYLLARILLDLLSFFMLSTRFLAAVNRSFAGRRRMLYCISVHLLRHCEQHIDSSLTCFWDESEPPAAAFFRDLLFKRNSIFRRKLVT